MKRAIEMSLFGLLAMGLSVSCKPEKGEEPFDPDYTAETDYTVTTYGLNMEMVYVEGGTFEMGATAEQGEDAYVYEKPVRTIRLDGFHIGKYEVVQAQWEAVMGTNLKEQRDKANPEGRLAGEGDNYPMYYVSWDEAQEFCKKLSEATGKKYVLPTEAQWEYAARGGNKSQHYKYAGSNDIDEVAWYNNNSDGWISPVGSKKANELGCYDMSGNIDEWCSDWEAEDGKYDENDTENPQGPVSGSYRMLRSGNWEQKANYCRVSCRGYSAPSGRSNRLGFRVACIAE